MEIIRKAKPKDARRISTLRRQTLENVNKNDYPKPALEVLKKNYSPKSILERMVAREMFVLTDNNRILGTVEFNPESGRVQGLYIDYRYMGKGYGAMLMQYVEDFARSKKVKRIILYSTKTAQNFYKKIGYKLVKQGKTTYWTGEGFRVRDIFMQKRV
jgi:N-acetylglutamate synthase-like GNAT family acetyltransferase